MVRDTVFLRSMGLVLLVAWFVVGCQPPSIATPPASLSNGRIKDLHNKIVTYLDKGDLVSARRAILEIPTDLRVWGCVRRSDVESMGFSYFFPEGEALQFFFWHKDVISQIEFRSDALNLVWQARLEKGRGRLLSETGAVSRYLNREGYRVVEQCGSQVAIAEPLVFFRLEPSVGSLEYGRVSLDGQFSVLGRANVASSSRMFVDVPGGEK